MIAQNDYFDSIRAFHTGVMQRGKQNIYFLLSKSAPQGAPPAPSKKKLCTCSHNCHASLPHRCNACHQTPTSPRICATANHIVASLFGALPRLILNMYGLAFTNLVHAPPTAVTACTSHLCHC